MLRRAVHNGPAFLDRARQLFPPGGSPDGRPSFELFAGTVLRGAETARQRLRGPACRDPRFSYPDCSHGRDTVLSQPLAFSALLADEETVEIVDVVIDEDWLETLGDDFA